MAHATEAANSAPAARTRRTRTRRTSVAGEPSARLWAQQPEPATAMLEHERAVVDAALAILAKRLRQLTGPVFSSPTDARNFLVLTLAHYQHEVFGAMFLDAQHRLIAFEELFRGTLTQTSVYPREVVLRALQHHAAAVVLAHNHPSGSLRPSVADESLTRTLKAALGLVDVQVLDHFVVAGCATTSMAELGLV